MIDFVTQTCWDRWSNRDNVDAFVKFIRKNNLTNLYADNNFNFLEKYLIPPQASFGSCSGLFLNEHVDWTCNKALYMLITETGPCYSFNINLKDRILKEGVSFPLNDEPNSESDFIQILQNTPINLQITNDKLEIKLHFFGDFVDELCNKPYIFYIHSPNDIPWNDARPLDVNNFGQIDVALSPVLIKTQDALRSMSPRRRKCCFEDECSLKYFKLYTKNNCLMECYTIMMHERCQCVLYHLPRGREQKICILEDIPCILKNLKIKLNIDKHCECLDDCNSLKYNVKTTYTEVTLSASKQEKSKQNDTDFGFSSYLVIQFELSEFLAMNRVSTYSFVDFVSQIGGVFGLFMGISMISFVEIVYFCTVRVCKPVIVKLFQA